MDRPYVSPRTWSRFKAHARKHGLPASTFLGLLMRGYCEKPFPIYLIPEREDAKQ